MIDDVKQVTKDFFKINDLLRYYWASMMFKKFKNKIYLDIATESFSRLDSNK